LKVKFSPDEMSRRFPFVASRWQWDLRGPRLYRGRPAYPARKAGRAVYTRILLQCRRLLGRADQVAIDL